MPSAPKQACQPPVPVAEQFAVEVAVAGVDTLVELNRYWIGWVEQVYHRRIVRTTGQSPLERWLAGPSSLRAAPDPDALSQAFWWTVQRTVAATRTISLHGNLYEVDPALVGRRIQLRYDPTDLTAIHVFDGDTRHGLAVPARAVRRRSPLHGRIDGTAIRCPPTILPSRAHGYGCVASSVSPRTKLRRSPLSCCAR